jgi:hypothetical protein
MRSEVMRPLLRHAVAMLRNPRVVGLHLILNAALLVAASFWLLIPEEHVWQLLFAAFSALLMVVVFLWLHSGTLAYAADPVPASFRSAFSIKISRLAWLLLGGAILFWCMHIVDGWTESEWQIAGYLYSKAPSWLRPNSGADSYATALRFILSVVYWYVLPCIFLPLIASRVAGGTALHALRSLARWQYWLAMAIATLLGVWVTNQILGWTPGKTLSQQTLSLVIRLIVAYLVATTAWLATAGLLGYFVGSHDDDAPANVVRKTAA